MRRISKTGFVLTDNSGETMVEVLVAFALLSIMLLIFSQGLAWATTAEARAYDSRIAADQAMADLKTELATSGTARPVTRINYFNDRIKRFTYTYNINGQTFTYIHYEPIVTGGGG